MKKYMKSIDLLRGMCLVLMVFINFFDEITKVSILSAKQGVLIDFLVTSMVPNVFITLMGFLLVLSGGYKPEHIFAKAIKILFVGFAINLIRVPVPQIVGNLLGVTQYGDLLKHMVYHLSMIDIYSFAGYALFLVMPLSYFELPFQLYFVLSALVMLLSSYKQVMLDWLPAFLHFIFGYLFVGEPKNVYFPLFPWFAYLLLGIGLGLLYLKHGQHALNVFLTACGAICIGIGYAIFKTTYHYGDFSMLNDFYKHDYTVGLYLAGMAMLLFVFVEALYPHVPAKLLHYFAFTSRHIIKLYFFSWLFTGWFVTLRGMHNDFGVCESLLGSLFVYLLSVAGVLTLEKVCISQLKDSEGSSG